MIDKFLRAHADYLAGLCLHEDVCAAFALLAPAQRRIALGRPIE